MTRDRVLRDTRIILSTWHCEGSRVFAACAMDSWRCGCIVSLFFVVVTPFAARAWIIMDLTHAFFRGRWNEFMLAGIACVTYFLSSPAFCVPLLVYHYEMMAGAPFCDISVCCCFSSLNCIQNVLFGDVFKCVIYSVAVRSMFGGFSRGVDFVAGRMRDCVGYRCAYRSFVDGACSESTGFAQLYCGVCLSCRAVVGVPIGICTQCTCRASRICAVLVWTAFERCAYRNLKGIFGVDGQFFCGVYLRCLCGGVVMFAVLSRGLYSDVAQSSLFLCWFFVVLFWCFCGAVVFCGCAFWIFLVAFLYVSLCFCVFAEKCWRRVL